MSLQAVRGLVLLHGPDGAEPCTGAGLADQLAGRAVPRAPGIPAVDATGEPVLLGGVLVGEPGWQVWPQAVAARSPDEIRAEVEVSGLRGRSGAGIPGGSEVGGNRWPPEGGGGRQRG
ncbi:hypothetical protein [Saccharopolyspora phatthalungensis]|uniref:Uncharacterized protein n=1 Tax=Saccharopolyspora phatthalungensis TaxID=664693 RepID=A0A840QBP8_9PSEU|nr:hypothetical protein [Saccharopolyspora phatthalungensis]MBB5155979.1 hypothetical protein [Saccharopolyspora phatthalungensis]